MFSHLSIGFLEELAPHVLFLRVSTVLKCPLRLPLPFSSEMPKGSTGFLRVSVESPSLVVKYSMVLPMGATRVPTGC